MKSHLLLPVSRTIAMLVAQGRIRGLAMLLLSFAATGCHVYVPYAGVQPEPGERVAVTVSDQGRVALGPHMGPGVTRIEGTIVERRGDELYLRVSQVQSVSGISHWAGERVALRQEHASQLWQRKLSRGRTTAAIAGAVVGVGVFIATHGLGTFGVRPGRGPNTPEPPES